MQGEIALNSTYQAICILRDYEIGATKSVEFNPDKVQISQKRYPLRVSSGTSVAELELHSETHALWVILVQSLCELKRIYSDNPRRFSAFYFHHIGQKTDRGRLLINEDDLAKVFGVKPRTIQNWCSGVYRDFQDVLERRGLLEPDS